MSLLKPFTTATFLSKSAWIALLFITLLFILFYALAQYQRRLTPTSPLLPNFLPTPTSISNTTSNWQIYTNSEYGISFSYPGEWEVRIIKSKDILNNAIVGFALAPKSDLPYVFAYLFTDDEDVYTKTNYMTNMEYLKSPSKKTINNALYKVTEFIIKYQENAGFSGPTETTLIVIERPNSMEKFLFDAYGTTSKEFYDIYSSFKFLE